MSEQANVQDILDKVSGYLLPADLAKLAGSAPPVAAPPKPAAPRMPRPATAPPPTDGIHVRSRNSESNLATLQGMDGSSTMVRKGPPKETIDAVVEMKAARFGEFLKAHQKNKPVFFEHCWWQITEFNVGHNSGQHDQATISMTRVEKPTPLRYRMTVDDGEEIGYNVAQKANMAISHNDENWKVLSVTRNMNARNYTIELEQDL